MSDLYNGDPSFDTQISSDELTQEYQPTEQDLADMAEAWASEGHQANEYLVCDRDLYHDRDLNEYLNSGGDLSDYYDQLDYSDSYGDDCDYYD